MESGNLETFPQPETQTADEAQGAAGATLVEQEPNIAAAVSQLAICRKLAKGDCFQLK
jgi:hypothetical protein